MGITGGSELDIVARKNGKLPLDAGAAPNRGKRDAELIQACLDGDQTAWQELVLRYGRLVYSIPRRYGLSDSDADDVFQNVFTIVFRRLATLRDQARLTAWLITVTHREALRLSKRLPPASELDESAEDGAAPPLDQVQNWERQHIVHQALDQLGSPCRELLTALFLDPDDNSYDKIASRLGIPIGGVGPTRARCFKKLEAILIRLGFDSKI